MTSFFFHFALILTVSCCATFSILARGHSYLPHSLDKYWQKAEVVAAAALGQTLAGSNPIRQALNGYINSAGIEGGYGFFAPSIPNSPKLVFELHYDDGRIEYELPRVHGDAAGLRLTELLEQIRAIEYEPLRELMLKMLAFSSWRGHPEATRIRAVFGYVDTPSATEFEHGEKETYKFMYAYDFCFLPPPDGSKTP